MTYGQVATAAGLPGRARMVGRVMRQLPEGSNVPWQRVVNAQGRISKRGDYSGGEWEQRLRLESEGVRFGASGAIDLATFGWFPHLRAEAGPD
jgi:methylated-DNA-protein-cysteine methyltransferase-like protein